MTALDSVKTLTHRLRLFGFHGAIEKRLAEAQRHRISITESSSVCCLKMKLSSAGGR